MIYGNLTNINLTFNGHFFTDQFLQPSGHGNVNLLVSLKKVTVTAVDMNVM